MDKERNHSFLVILPTFASSFLSKDRLDLLGHQETLENNSNKIKTPQTFILENPIAIIVKYPSPPLAPKMWTRWVLSSSQSFLLKLSTNPKAPKRSFSSFSKEIQGISIASRERERKGRMKKRVKWSFQDFWLRFGLVQK